MPQSRPSILAFVLVTLLLIGQSNSPAFALGPRVARPSVAVAEQWFPDPTFGVGGVALTQFPDEASAGSFVVLPDGRVVVCGKSGEHLALAMFSSSGVLDASFDGDGTLIGPEGNAGDLMYVGGALMCLTDDSLRIASYDLTGVRDPAVHGQGVSGVDRIGPCRMEMTASGDFMLVGGWSGIYSSEIYLAKRGPTGELNLGYGIDGFYRTGIGQWNLRDLAVYGDGSAVICGYTRGIFESNDFLLKLDPDGEPVWTAGAGWSSGLAVAMVSGFRIVESGGSVTGIQLARFQPNGNLDPSFGVGGQSNPGLLFAPSRLMVLPDGKLLASGVPGLGLARLTESGGFDSTFNDTSAVSFDGVADPSVDVAIQPDGKLLALGTIDHQFAIVRYTRHVNHAPTVAPISDPYLLAGDHFAITPVAADADDDVLQWTAVNLPGGASLSASTGTLAWIPTIAQVGVYPVLLIVDDGQGGADSVSFAMHVLPRPSAPRAGLATEYFPPRDFAQCVGIQGVGSGSGWSSSWINCLSAGVLRCPGSYTWDQPGYSNGGNDAGTWSAHGGGRSQRTFADALTGKVYVSCLINRYHTSPELLLGDNRGPGCDMTLAFGSLDARAAVSLRPPGGTATIAEGSFIDGDVTSLLIATVTYDYNATGDDSVAVWVNPPDLTHGEPGLGTPSVTLGGVDVGSRWELMIIEPGTANAIDALRVSYDLPGVPASLQAVLGGSCTFQQTGVGACGLDGGSTHAGGVDIAFDSILAPGEFTSWHRAVPISDFGTLAEIFADPNTIHFALATDPVDFWDLRFSGEFADSATITFGYADAMRPGFTESDLAIFHFDGARWVKLTAIARDTAANWIRVRVASLSPFALGVETGEPVASVPPSGPAGRSILSLHLLGAARQSEIELTVGRRDRVRVDVVDVQGRTRVKLVDEVVEAGARVLKLSPSSWGLKSGVYWITARNGAGVRASCKWVWMH